MALERKSPLPKGIYWADFFNPPVGGASITGIKAWLESNRDSVSLLKSSYHGPDKDPVQAFVSGAYTLSPALAAVASILPGTGTERLWVLFQVKNPVPWPALDFGYPTIAEQSTTEADTVSGRTPESYKDEWLAWFSNLFKSSESEKPALDYKFLAAITVAGGIALVYKYRRFLP